MYRQPPIHASPSDAAETMVQSNNLTVGRCRKLSSAERCCNDVCMWEKFEAYSKRKYLNRTRYNAQNRTRINAEKRERFECSPMHLGSEGDVQSTTKVEVNIHPQPASKWMRRLFRYTTLVSVLACFFLIFAIPSILRSTLITTTVLCTSRSGQAIDHSRRSCWHYGRLISNVNCYRILYVL